MQLEERFKLKKRELKETLLPIKVIRQPALEQEIDIGDTIDLTVRAETDVSQTQNLNYKWLHFRNKSSVVGEDPKFTVNDQHTKEAYINTTGMSEAEYEFVRGTYLLNISHMYESKLLTITVTLKDKPVPEEPATAEAGFDMWIIGLIIGILFLIIVIIIIIFVICRKQQEGDYNVDKKETRAGLDPEKELKDKGFNEFSRPTFDDYDYPDKKPKGDLEYDDVPIGGDDESLGEYGDEEDTHFNEDGSFIGIYDKKEPPRPAAQTNESTI
ncbi:hypothetical protein Btru_041975 [Bulinus truncatus]|nr:hypothetical protein Btru_041975 [Bulinus truncatus]